MHVKRLYGSTVRDALAAAREELGPGALVLSTELVPANGWRGWMGQRMVRLTAAAERAEHAEAQPAEVPQVSENRPRRPVRRQPRADEARAGLTAKLAATGLDQALAEAVTKRMTDAECRGGGLGQALQRALAAELEGLSGADSTYARYEVFVGPPGVGKTTTIAKIAAQERAAGTEPLGLVAADAYRAGAIEQLRSYAAIIGAPFRVARSAKELDQALGAARRTALVDTAGRSPGDDELSGLFDLIAHKRGVRTHLVLAADTSPATAVKIFDRYAPANPTRVVITKLDESESVRPLLSVIRQRGLPVSYLTAGQRVPEDLSRATPSCLAAALLGENATEARAC